MNQKKPSSLSRILGYAGGHKNLTILGCVLSALSAVLGLVPYLCVWLAARSVLDTWPDPGGAENLGRWGWTAVWFAIGSILLYFAALMSTHIAATFSAKLQIQRMRSILEQPEQTGTEDFHPTGCDITFDHVSFAYREGVGVLKDVSFTARQGEVTALIGPSGGGKTTACKLAARFWDVTAGKVTLGGTDVSTVDPETLLRFYSMVFQDVVLFRDTVMENIRLGRRGATDAEVLEAAYRRP